MGCAETIATRCVSALFFLALLAALPGCMQGESNVSAGNRLGILHIGNGSEPQSLDPHVLTSVTDFNIASSLFEGLVTQNPYTLAIEPGVARRWDVSADHKTLTFYLNPAAQWSNGEPVTAQDFLYSFRRILAPAMANQVAYLLYPIRAAEAFSRGRITDPDKIGVRVVNDHTLEITLNNPTPYFLSVLASYVGYPVHRATIEAHGQATDRFTGWTRPANFVGNGPFTLSAWRMQREVTVTRNTHYWDTKHVALNGMVFHAVESPLVEEKMFRMGQLHVTSTVPLAKIAGYRAQPNSPYHQAPQLGTYYYMFNTRRPPVDDLRVRRALAMAVDRRALIDAVLLGTGIPSPSLTPMNLIPGYNPPDLLTYNPAGARALLAEAGYPDGAGWPGLELIYNTSEDHRKVAVAVQQMWRKELNIKVTLANQEWKVFLDTTQQHNFQLARMGWLGTYRDPTVFLEGFTTDSGTNNTGFSNARYDKILLQLAPATLDSAQRMALLREAETLLMKQVPLIPFYTYNSKHLIQPSVRGAPPNVADILNYKYISLDPSAGTFNYKD